MSYANKKTAIKKQNQWIAAKCDRINLTVPKGKKKVIHEYAKLRKTSVNKLIYDLICKELSSTERK